MKERLTEREASHIRLVRERIIFVDCGDTSLGRMAHSPVFRGVSSCCDQAVMKYVDDRDNLPKIACIYQRD